MSAEWLDRSAAVPAESPASVAAASVRGDGEEVGATAPAESTEPRADAVFVSPTHGGDGDTLPEWTAPGGGGVVPGAELEANGFVDGHGIGGDEGGEAEASWEGAGVTVLRESFRLGVAAPRILPMPREDAVPDPVVSRRGRSGDGRFRRNPSVDEAISELTRPLVEPSEAERAAATLRSKRPVKAGGAMRLPSAEGERASCTPQQRLLLLDTWTRSGLPAGDFGVLVGVSKHTLYNWKKRFDEMGPAGLEDAARGGSKGSKMPEVTKRAILMIKQAHPEYGCERISDLLARGPALPASAGAVAKVLKEAGYESVERPTERHAPPVRRFERAKPNALWQTDLFTFVLKRQNRRLHMVVFMDDHSRFIVGWGLFSSPSTEWVTGVLKEAAASCQAPEELLTDNGPQYVTWRGHSKFRDACIGLGIKQIVAKPRRPQTLGKVERFWGTLWREFLAEAIFEDGHDARHRIGLFIDAYNFDRPHQGMDGATPAERYFGHAAEAKAARDRRLAENARRLAAGLEPITGDGSLPLGDAVNAVPAPGADPLTAGLSAAAGTEG